jgi:hypothetical protein
MAPLPQTRPLVWRALPAQVKPKNSRNWAVHAVYLLLWESQEHRGPCHTSKAEGAARALQRRLMARGTRVDSREEEGVPWLLPSLPPERASPPSHQKATLRLEPGSHLGWLLQVVTGPSNSLSTGHEAEAPTEGAEMKPGCPKPTREERVSVSMCTSAPLGTKVVQPGRRAHLSVGCPQVGAPCYLQ